MWSAPISGCLQHVCTHLSYQLPFTILARTDIKNLHGFIDPLKMLEVQLQAKASKDASYCIFHKELSNITVQLAAFCSASMDMLYSLHTMDKVQASTKECMPVFFMFMHACMAAYCMCLQSNQPANPPGAFHLACVVEATDDTYMQKMKDIEKAITLSKHHCAGAKAAKTRFAGILNVEDPKK